MFVAKSKATIYKKPSCVVREYGGVSNLDLGVAEINGKYPMVGWARNKEVDMTYFVIEGKGKFWLEDEVYQIEKEDFVLIERGRWYRCEGDLKVVMVSSPAWSPGQYEEREEK